MNDFNQYIAFDGWQLERQNAEIRFRKISKIEIPASATKTPTEEQFLSLEFKDVSIDALNLSTSIADVLKSRLGEIKNCLANNSPLAVIFLAGSTLEGVLLGMATHYPREFNQSRAAPKDQNGKVKQFHEWSLSHFIEAAYELGLLKEDVKKFSHSLRDFRNYIHPYQQSVSNFSPDIHTAKISWQVLKAALHQLKAP